MHRNQRSASAVIQFFPTITPPADQDVRAVRVLRTVSGLLGGVFTIAWATTLILGGGLAEEFASFGQWGPSLFTIAAFVAMFGTTFSKRVAPRTLLRIGLVFMVAVSFGLAATQYVVAFDGVPREFIDRDRVGLSTVALWMLGYAVLVPTPPRWSLAALLAAAAAVPIVYLASVAVGQAPRLPVSEFILVFVFPYVVTAAVAYAAVRLINRLTRDAKRAAELGSYRLRERLGGGEAWVRCGVRATGCSPGPPPSR